MTTSYTPATVKDLILTTDPRAIAAASMLQAMSNYFAVFPSNDGRDISPQLRAYEAQFKMSFDPTAIAFHGDAAMPIIHSIRAGATLALSCRVPFPLDATIEHVNLNGVNCYWVSYPHHHHWKQGGCFLFGSIKSHGGLYAEISRSFRMPILFVEYSLTPETQFPKQREELLNVHRALLELDSSCASRMIVYGESAGGHLSLFYTQMVIAENLSIPAACIAVSPYCDFTCSTEAYTKNAKTEVMMSLEQSKWFLREASLNVDASSTEMNLFNGSFKSFPRTYIWASASEILAGDAEKVLHALEKAGVDVTHFFQPHCPHNLCQYPSIAPEAILATSKMLTWLHQ